ncbi:MAG: hypothetical protein JXR95_12140 [Deltaproteobacteria bacterium]|nr:hypothetical protein [Deltaproteobacteria bacterium]
MFFYFTLALLLAPAKGEILFEPGVVDFTKISNDLSSFSKITGKGCPKKGGIVTGYSLARRCSDREGLWEIFVAGEPVSKNHRIISWDVPVQEWVTVAGKIHEKTRPEGKILITGSSRLEKYGNLLKSEFIKSGLKVQLKLFSDEVSILKMVASLRKINRNRYWLIIPLDDPDVVTALVLKELFQIQYRYGVKIFVRSKHEVLMGGLLSIEVAYTPTYINAVINGDNPQIKLKKHYNPDACESLDIPGKVFEKIKFTAISR